MSGANASHDNSKNAELKGEGRTSGKGCLKRTSDGYINTTTKADKIRSYKGVSLLDESQWVLHIRGAFMADDRSSKYVSQPISNTPVQQKLKRVGLKKGFILTQLF